MLQSIPSGRFPSRAGIVFGLGLGGFFDGIVFHQLLQFHHMVSSWYPPTTIGNLRLNTLWDGIFHSTTYLLVVLALWLFWRVARTHHLYWSTRLIWGSVLLGWGIFNLAEGVVDHEILGVHHVNELVPLALRPAWDIGFLVWGALMLVGGWALWRSGLARQAGESAAAAGHA